MSKLHNLTWLHKSRTCLSDSFYAIKVKYWYFLWTMLGQLIKKTELAPRRSWKTCSRYSFPPSCEISLCVSPIRYLSHFSGLFMNFYAFRFAYGLWPLKKICLSGAGGSAAAKFDKAWRVGRVNIESVGRIRVRFSAWTSWLGNWGISAS